MFVYLLYIFLGRVFLYRFGLLLRQNVEAEFFTEKLHFCAVQSKEKEGCTKTIVLSSTE